MARRIAVATTEEKTASTETAVNMERISSLTEENNASVHRVGREAGELSATAVALEKLVDQFKLP